MPKILRYAGQLAAYAAFIAALGYFSTVPSYVHVPPDHAIIKLSFLHAGERKGGCRQRTPEELAKLPPNMRAPMSCPRERAPIEVALEVDGRLIDHEIMPPAGLKKDGEASVYQRYPIPAGTHTIRVRLKDREGTDYNYERTETVNIAAGRALLIDFKPIEGGFVIK